MVSKIWELAQLVSARFFMVWICLILGLLAITGCYYIADAFLRTFGEFRYAYLWVVGLSLLAAVVWVVWEKWHVRK